MGQSILVEGVWGGFVDFVRALGFPLTNEPANASAAIVGDLSWARDLRRRFAFLPVIFVTKQSSEALAIEALRAGVNDYLCSPSHPSELHSVLRRVLPQRCVSPSSDLRGGERLVGYSAVLDEAKRKIQQVAATDFPVLIQGETGTGKELVAELIHQNSRRATAPFVTLNCAAIPESLLESELFGHERGAFTGAFTASEGKLRAASGGTVFLDEVGDLTSLAQAKLLRVIENREAQRLGASRSMPVDVRFLCAVNRDLESQALEGQFRKDLYYRLSAVRIDLPPLRQRKEDIVVLVDHFIPALNRTLGRQVEGLTEDAVTALLRHDWPGNVRELQHTLESAILPVLSGRIGVDDLPSVFRAIRQAVKNQPPEERERLLAVLSATRWNISEAAQRLRWSRMTVYRKLNKYRIQRNRTASDGPSR